MSKAEKDECGLRCSEASIATKQEVRAKTIPDGGFSWFVVFGSFMIQFVVMGVHNTFGLLYIELQKEFSEVGKATVAWIGSSSFSFAFLIGPVTTALCTKFGCRRITVLGGLLFGLGLFLSSYVNAAYQLFFTYSLLFSAGSSCCYFTSVLILREYFSRKLAFANGIGLSGCGLGTLVLTPLINYFIDTFHWREAVQILSALSLILLLVGWIYFAVTVPLPSDETTSQIPEAPKLFDASLLRNKAFVLWIAAVGLVSFGFYIPYVHLVQHGQDLGIPKAKCAVLVGSMSISQTVGKIVFGRLSDSPCVNRIYLLQTCLLVCSVMSTLLPVFVSFESLLVYCIIFGLHDGCFVVHIAILTGDIVGKKNMMSAFGLMHFFASPPMMLGPPVAGWMYEIIHNYEPAFYMSGALTILAVCILFVVPFFIPPEVEQEWNEKSNETEKTVSSNSPSTVNERVFLAQEYNDCKESTKNLDKFFSESNQGKRTFTASMESITQKYFSMPKLVAWEDCILPRMFLNSTENLWNLLDTSRETHV